MKIECPKCGFHMDLDYIRRLNRPGSRDYLRLPVALSDEENNRLMQLDANHALEDAYFPKELKGISPNLARFASICIKYDINNNISEIVCVCNYRIVGRKCGKISTGDISKVGE